MDYAFELPPVPLQKETTITESTVGPCITVSPELLDAWEAWRNIKDVDERRKVGANIAQRMQELQ